MVSEVSVVNLKFAILQGFFYAFGRDGHGNQGPAVCSTYIDRRGFVVELNLSAKVDVESKMHEINAMKYPSIRTIQH